MPASWLEVIALKLCLDCWKKCMQRFVSESIGLKQDASIELIDIIVLLIKISNANKASFTNTTCIRVFTQTQTHKQNTHI